MQVVGVAPSWSVAWQERATIRGLRFRIRSESAPLVHRSVNSSHPASLGVTASVLVPLELLLVVVVQVGLVRGMVTLCVVVLVVVVLQLESIMAALVLALVSLMLQLVLLVLPLVLLVLHLVLLVLQLELLELQ